MDYGYLNAIRLLATFGDMERAGAWRRRGEGICVLHGPGPSG
jgi:hypothetical protein